MFNTKQLAILQRLLQKDKSCKIDYATVARKINGLGGGGGRSVSFKTVEQWLYRQRYSLRHRQRDKNKLDDDTGVLDTTRYDTAKMSKHASSKAKIRHSSAATLRKLWPLSSRKRFNRLSSSTSLSCHVAPAGGGELCRAHVDAQVHCYMHR